MDAGITGGADGKGLLTGACGALLQALNSRPNRGTKRKRGMMGSQKKEIAEKSPAKQILMQIRAGAASKGL